MPWGDGTGPQLRGAMNGRGAGRCARGNGGRGARWGRGFGWGWKGVGMEFAQESADTQSLEQLKIQAAQLESSLADLKLRMHAFER